MHNKVEDANTNEVAKGEREDFVIINSDLNAETKNTTLSKEVTDNSTLKSKNISKESACVPLNGYGHRRSWITTDRINELRRKALEAMKQNKTFTIRGCFQSVRNALICRGWVEKLDMHRKHFPTGICQISYEDLSQGLPKRKAGETRSQYINKCERNIMSRFLEHMPIDFLWTNRKEKCDYIDQAKNPTMTINKFHRAPFTSKEGLCNQLKDFHWFYEENIAEMYFPRCFNVWNPEELSEFVENYKLTACIAFIRIITEKYELNAVKKLFSTSGKIPYSAVEFAFKRCTEFIECCQHCDIDFENSPKIWDHEWDLFLYQHYQVANESMAICIDDHHDCDTVLKTANHILDTIKSYWPQYSLDGWQNLWIVKPANKCRGRGIQLLDNLKKILTVVNPPIASKSRYVVQKYIEKPLTIHNTKFDIRQWFLITNVQPLIIWMYKESYLRFSSQEYNLSNYHESVHLTNYAIQKKYGIGKRDKRLPNENMWDCYSFQAYLRQIGKYDMWLSRIYPGMRKAIVGTMLASQENMDRRSNTFELFGADFMICENFYPWLIEINSSPDLSATTSVTARMCPQCLEDVIKVVIDRRLDAKTDVGNFELAYRQMIPPTPAYMGLNLFVKGKQVMSKVNNCQASYHQRKEHRLFNVMTTHRQKTSSISHVHKEMPMFNATEIVEKNMGEVSGNSRGLFNGGIVGNVHQYQYRSISTNAKQNIYHGPTSTTACPNLLKSLHTSVVLKRSYTNLSKCHPNILKVCPSKNDPVNVTMKRYGSCGPRLNYNNYNKDKDFKLYIKKYPHEKNKENNIEQFSKKHSIQNTHKPHGLSKVDTKHYDLAKELKHQDSQALELLKNGKKDQNVVSKILHQEPQNHVISNDKNYRLYNLSCLENSYNCRKSALMMNKSKSLISISYMKDSKKAKPDTQNSIYCHTTDSSLNAKNREVTIRQYGSSKKFNQKLRKNV
ncbi:tubulin glycylase 3A [Teleopsis dalmanni]|uniref:tubulin glycylase 3A n=1 Tax=Teleopsis dalmanni TaxID=139649 RepID=UPI0018CFC1EF|nr:tubulin glycylase 3A [Teleopsis dalmanni]